MGKRCWGWDLGGRGMSESYGGILVVRGDGPGDGVGGGWVEEVSDGEGKEVVDL